MTNKFRNALWFMVGLFLLFVCTNMGRILIATFWKFGPEFVFLTGTVVSMTIGLGLFFATIKMGNRTLVMRALACSGLCLTSFATTFDEVYHAPANVAAQEIAAMAASVNGLDQFSILDLNENNLLDQSELQEALRVGGPGVQSTAGYLLDRMQEVGHVARSYRHSMPIKMGGEIRLMEGREYYIYLISRDDLKDYPSKVETENRSWH